MDNKFNLIDEPWIPVVDVGRVSLRDIFSNKSYRAIGGNPVQKIALTKLLLAIAQAAATPADEDEWKSLGVEGLATHVLEYLDRWHDRFFLYGDKPFLQMPRIAVAEVQSFGAVLPSVATGNTTVLTETQVERQLNDADKALLLIVQMGFALGGKKTDNSIVLGVGYQGKSNDKGKASTGKPGPSVAHLGLLHSLGVAGNVRETLLLNIHAESTLRASGFFPGGVGIAPWEAMPASENCDIAQQLRQSLMGRLVPLCRFCLFADGGMHYSEGIFHPSHKDGVVDPTVAVNFAGKEPKVLWVNPDKRPWRELSALLSFTQQQGGNFDCLQLKTSLPRAASILTDFAIWSGGLRVSSNAGEQYVSGSDDFVESIVWLHSSSFGENWFIQLQHEMQALDSLAKSVYGCVMAFFKQQLMEGDKHAALASNLFWQLCERQAQSLIDSCGTDETSQNSRYELRRRFASYAQQAYNQYCPQDTARQLDAWAKCRPNFSSYLRQEVK